MVEGSGVEGAGGTFVRSCLEWVALFKEAEVCENLKKLEDLGDLQLFRGQRFEDTQPENSIPLN